MNSFAFFKPVKLKLFCSSGSLVSENDPRECYGSFVKIGQGASGSVFTATDLRNGSIVLNLSLLLLSLSFLILIINYFIIVIINYFYKLYLIKKFLKFIYFNIFIIYLDIIYYLLLLLLFVFIKSFYFLL
jgi:hypothetical protein